MRKHGRKPKGKPVNPTYFVFCEGETEEAYIHFLRTAYRLPIEIDAKVSGSRINERYIAAYKKTKVVHPKDKTYLMYDLDVEGVLGRLQKIKETTLLVSNPCFELWYLLHFQNQQAALSSDECMSLLSKRLKNYQKGSICDELKRTLSEKQQDAVSRSKAFDELNNPSTKIYRLIEDLEKAKPDW